MESDYTMKGQLLIFPINGHGKCNNTLSPDVRRCSKSDPELNKCLDTYVTEATRKFANGNKDLGIPSLEPFFIEKVDLGNITSGAVSLHQVYTNMKIYGITEAIIKDSDARFDKDNCYWRFKTISPVTWMESDYSMKGQLLIFAIDGHGKCNNTFYDVEIYFDAKCDRYTKKGRTHLRITDFHYKMEPKKVVFHFDNIIDGNEQLSKEVLKTVNEDANAVYAEVAPAFNQVIGSIYGQTASEVFKRVPEDELFLP